MKACPCNSYKNRKFHIHFFFFFFLSICFQVKICVQGVYTHSTVKFFFITVTCQINVHNVRISIDFSVFSRFQKNYSASPGQPIFMI